MSIDKPHDKTPITVFFISLRLGLNSFGGPIAPVPDISEMNSLTVQNGTLNGVMPILWPCASFYLGLPAFRPLRRLVFPGPVTWEHWQPGQDSFCHPPSP